MCVCPVGNINRVNTCSYSRIWEECVEVIVSLSMVQ